MIAVPKTPLPVRQTRSSRNRKLAESVKKEEGLDLIKSEDKENEVKEEKTQPRTRSTRNREKSKENSSQVRQVFLFQFSVSTFNFTYNSCQISFLIPFDFVMNC